MSALKQVQTYISEHGVLWTLRRAWEKAEERWLAAYDKQARAEAPDETELQRQREHQPNAGLISVIVPVYNVRPELLLALADSLIAQTYQNWEACLYDGCSPNPMTHAALQEAAKRDSRIHVRFGKVNEGISGNSNRALAMAQGRYAALCDHDDLLTPDALWRMAEAAVRTGAELLYSDEDKITEDDRLLTDPHWKPALCPDNLRSGNYICHLMMIKRTLLDAVGGFRPAFDGSQDHDLALRCMERANCVTHVPYVLYHWRTVGASMSHQQLARCRDAACRAVQEHMQRIGWPGTAEMAGNVIRLRYEIRRGLTVRAIVLNTAKQDKSATCLHALQNGGWPIHNVTVLDVPQDAWQAQLNHAVAEAREDVLLILRAEMQPDAGLVRELLMYAQRDDAGMVTAAALKHGRLVHAGYALMADGRVLGRNSGMLLRAGGWHGLAQQSHNVAAVGSLCLMVRRDHYQPLEEKGSAEVALVQACLRMGERGLHHVYTPHAMATCSRNMLPPVHLPQPVDDPCMSKRHIYSRKADFSISKSKR